MKPLLILAMLLVLAVNTVSAAPATPKPSASPVPETTASPNTDIDPETIKANIKKRIEQAVQNQAATTQRKVAYVGTLLSVTTTSFNLETSQGIKQASTSANTVFVSLPSNREIKIDDVSISDYLTAMGYVNDTTKVLDARRILVMKTPPSTPSYKSFYGRITNVDAKKSVITMVHPKSGDERSFKISSKTKLFVTDPAVGKAKTELKSLHADSIGLMVYNPAQTKSDDNTGITLLVKSASVTDNTNPSPSPSNASPTPKTKPSPTPKPSPAN